MNHHPASPPTPAERATVDDLSASAAGARDWDETPAEAARYDDRYWDAIYDRDEG